MDNNQPTAPVQKPVEEQSWQFIKKAILFFSSDWKHAVIFFAALALVILSTVLVAFPSKKQVKNPEQVSIPRSDSTGQNSNQTPTLPASLPNPTKEWELVSKKDFSVKISPSASIAYYKENINGASGSAMLRISLDSQEATQSGLVIEITKKDPPFKIMPIVDSSSSDLPVDLSKQAYLLNLNNPNIRIITKPIDILIGGFKGYEFYLEGSEVKGYFGSSSFKKGKIRIIEFSTNDKHYVLIGSLDPQVETILSTLIMK